MDNPSNVLVFAGETPEAQKWAEAVCKHSGIELSKCKIARFNDDESQPQLQESVSNKICVIVTNLHQTLSRNSNDNIMVLMQMCWALYSSQASEIVVLAPYTPMARQDKPDDKRSCVGIGHFANILKASCPGVPIRYITFDLHAAQIMTVFQSAGILCDNLHTEPHIISYVKLVMMEEMEITNNDIVVVGPDGGAAKRARRVAEPANLDCAHAHMDKVRSGAGHVSSVTLTGDVKNKHAIITDDMVDTGGTIIKAAEKLKEEGALSVSIMVCHGVLSKNAIERLSNCEAISLVVTTNTCDKQYPLSKPIIVGSRGEITYHYLENAAKIRMIDVTWLAAQALIRRVGKDSVHKLFEMKATSQIDMEFKMEELRQLQMEEGFSRGSKTPVNHLERAYIERITKPVEFSDTNKEYTLT